MNMRLSIFFILNFFSFNLLQGLNVQQEPENKLSEIINNTDQTISLAYPSQADIKIISCKSTVTGEQALFKATNSKYKTEITLPSKTITSVEGQIIPQADIEGPQCYLRIGVSIGFGENIEPITPNNKEGKYGVFALIRMKKNKMEVIFKEKFLEFADNNFIPISQVINEQNYVLEINSSKSLSVVPRTRDKIRQYLNPGRIPAQEFLLQAITNDSVESIEEAIAQGANINMGVGNQPPLLLAVIMDKEKAIKKLLSSGANPNIRYANQPLVSYIIKRFNFKLALIFLNRGLILSDLEKTDIINYIIFKGQFSLNQDLIDILRMLGYNITDNFNSNDLSKNKWYLLLYNNLGQLGFIRQDIVKLFLKNGANPNKVFQMQDGTKRTPMLLVIDSYAQLRKKGRFNESYGQKLTVDLLSDIIASGGNVNFTVRSLPQDREESLLSYALRWDEVGAIIDFLMKQHPSIDIAIELFLRNGGSINQKIKSPIKSGSSSLLWLAVENNNARAVQLLVNAGLGDNEALKLAISKGYGDIINILMNRNH